MNTRKSIRVLDKLQTRVMSFLINRESVKRTFNSDNIEGIKPFVKPSGTKKPPSGGFCFLFLNGTEGRSRTDTPEGTGF